MTPSSSHRRGRRPRGISLVELMVAMSGLSLVLATTATLLHGALRAQSESRRFLDDERACVRLARQVRDDLHRAASIVPSAPRREADAAVVVVLRMPDGRRVEYRIPDRRDRIVRFVVPADGAAPVAREDYRFAGPVAASVEPSVDGGSRRWVFRVAPPSDAATPPDAAERRRKPPFLVVEAELGRDLRFARPAAGGGAP